MQVSSLWKALSVAAIATVLNVPAAMAGGTNRDENTSATPDDKATTTISPSNPNEHRDEEGKDEKTGKQKSRSGSDSSGSVDSEAPAGDSGSSSGSSGSQY